jgi:hypothetical protein
MRAFSAFGAVLVVTAMAMPAALGDTLELADGTVLTNCYVRDEGTHFVVWESAQKVGTTDYRIIPRSQVAEKGDNPKIERPEAWDAHPQLPDLTITYIEMNPKLAGLHGHVLYEDQTNAPWIGGAPVLDKRVAELEKAGKSKFLNPEYIVQDLKLKYKPGETITFTAHVKNIGFAPAQPFQYRWLVDDKEVSRSTFNKPLAEMDETTFEQKYAWQDGFHTIGFEIAAGQREIATINNKATDAMWAWAYRFIVDKGRVAAWHRVRNNVGTFSWEDYYRWHVTMMNQLFAASVYPSAPKGIIARVRLDRIVYTDDITPEIQDKALNDPDGIGYHQGCWIWGNSEEENKTGVFADPDRNGRNSSEWSLPHELGHQLGLVDYYAIDYGGDDAHVWSDNGENVTHLFTHPIIMMAWHGPHLYSEYSAAYFNKTWDKPRGHFGDYYFDIPDENFLQILDVNSIGVPGAKVELFQRGEEVDTKTPGHVDQGVTWYDVIEDGDFGKPVSKNPVIVGNTDNEGVLRLPNRPVLVEVRTLNGYHRKANPWGNINVVGGRGLMLARVTKDDQAAWFWIQAVDFGLASYTGHKDKFTMVLKTPFASANSPNPPLKVAWEYVERKEAAEGQPASYVSSPNPTGLVRVTWEAPHALEQNYIERPIAYRIYRRVGSMGLNDRPWWPVGTVEPHVHGFIVDLKNTEVQDVGYYSDTQRFAVTTVAGTGVQSGLEQAVQKKPSQ